MANLSLSSLSDAQIETWIQQARQIAGNRLPSYVPLLSEVDPQQLDLAILGTASAVYESDSPSTFSLMSTIKPFLLLFLLEAVGKDVILERVGVEMSSFGFNSIQQLEIDGGWPRNPMLNSGAITLAGLLCDYRGNQAWKLLLNWLNKVSGSRLFLDREMLASVRELPNYTNQAIGALLARHKHLLDVEAALDTYNHICCFAGTVSDLARLGLILVKPAVRPDFQQFVRTLMFTCGLYEASGKYAVQVGLPAKSGVSGVVLAVVPRQGAIAIYSPPLDESGNSVAGIYLLSEISAALNLSVFNDS
ncbi:MAG: glutaminase [Cyanobacteria bacterium P01_H01_bin.15]